MSWISTITQGITSAFSLLRTPAPPIPPILLLCETLNRPGLSAMALTTAVIARLPEIGIETGVNPDGSANMVNLFIKVLIEEIVKEIKNNAVVYSAMPPGSLNIVGVSAGLGGGAVTASNAGISGFKGIVS